MARFEVPDGWTAQAYRYALDPSPAQQREFRSHAGGARKAYNTMLGLVKAVTGQRAAERSYGIADADLTPALSWSLAGLRKEWNRRKDDVAPWWAENSKEAYGSGLDALARGLDAWSKSRKGERAGAVAGFPVFKSARSRRSVRFTTGTIRVETDRHHVTTSPCRAWARSGRTSPPGSSPAGSRPGPRVSCLQPCPRIRPGGGSARSRSLSGAPPPSRGTSVPACLQPGPTPG